MTIAYVDTSGLVAAAFQDEGGPALARRLEDFSHLVSSNLLEAELRSAFARERCDFDSSIVSRIQWVLPDRSLAPEFATVLEAGYLRGADLWHVATALYVGPNPRDLFFVTLDTRQQSVAKALGFWL